MFHAPPWKGVRGTVGGGTCGFLPSMELVNIQNITRVKNRTASWRPGGLISEEVERRASAAGAERPPYLGICTEPKPKPKELVCDGGKVGVMPKEPLMKPLLGRV